MPAQRRRMPEKHEQVDESAPGEATRRRTEPTRPKHRNMPLYMPNEQIIAVPLSILLLALTPRDGSERGQAHRVSSI